MARVLFVEPFYGGSHATFLDGLIANSSHEIVPLTLPEGEWRSRMRRGAVELATNARDLNGDFDAIVATDMLDLPLFLALTRRRFERTPVLFYMHENQLTYPRIRGTKLNSWFGAMNYHSSLAADRVAFNSHYHRWDFLQALRILVSAPNNWLDRCEIDSIEAKSSVLPLGLDFRWIEADTGVSTRRSEGSPVILWNHRWEFDKAPDMFARVVSRLADNGSAFRLVIAGDPGPNPHPAMAELRERLRDRIVHFGRAETREEYARLLCASDIVVSTTRHEFFGISMLEAMYAGCFPIAPRDFTYRDLVPEDLHHLSLFEGEDQCEQLLRAAIENRSAKGHSVRRSALRFAWTEVAPVWDAAIDEMASLNNG